MKQVKYCVVGDDYTTLKIVLDLCDDLKSRFGQVAFVDSEDIFISFPDYYLGHQTMIESKKNNDSLTLIDFLKKIEIKKNKLLIQLKNRIESGKVLYIKSQPEFRNDNIVGAHTLINQELIKFNNCYFSPKLKLFEKNEKIKNYNGLTEKFKLNTLLLERITKLKKNKKINLTFYTSKLEDINYMYYLKSIDSTNILKITMIVDSKNLKVLRSFSKISKFKENINYMDQEDLLEIDGLIFKEKNKKQDHKSDILIYNFKPKIKFDYYKYNKGVSKIVTLTAIHKNYNSFVHNFEKDITEVPISQTNLISPFITQISTLGTDKIQDEIDILENKQNYILINSAMNNYFTIEQQDIDLSYLKGKITYQNQVIKNLELKGEPDIINKIMDIFRYNNFKKEINVLLQSLHDQRLPKI
jgi:hypothetical protein